MAKRKDAPSSVLTRSGRGTSAGIKASTDHLNTRKSPRFEKQIGPNPSTVKKKAEKSEKQMGSTPSTVKKKPDKSEKQMGSTPLRRSERGKNPVDVPALKVKSTKKSADISVASAEDVDKEKEDGSRDSKKRKRYNAVEFRARYKPQRVRVETEVLAHTECPSSSESPSSSGDQFWSAAVVNGTSVANETADGNANNLYQHLKPTVFELCNILKFSEGAKIIVERFLKFVIGNFNVSKEHTNVLEALMISVCWICSSLSKHTIDRKESFTLATVHLNFSCNEEEADQVYEKLKKPKEMFLECPMNLKVLNAYKDLPPIQGSGQILEEDIARKERNEIEKFDREWNEKKMTIINEFELEKTLIRYLYSSNSSVRSEKLNLVEKELADELNKHEKLRQVVVNNEISLNGLAHETQIVDLVECEKEDQEILEVSPALLGNQIEAEIHDKPVDDMCPMVVPDGVVNLSDTSNDMVSGSHTSEKHMANVMVLTEPIGEAPEKQDADTVNDVAEANATVLSEPIGDVPSNLDADMGNGVAGADATVLSEPIGDSPAIEIIASEQQDGVENVVSGDDAMVSSETIGVILAKQHAVMENDVAGADAMVLSEPIGDIPAIEEIASEQEDGVENVVSGDGAVILSEPIGESRANQDADMENDVAGAYATVVSQPIRDIPAIEEIASGQQDEVDNVVSSESVGVISANQDADMGNDVAGGGEMVQSEPIGDIPVIQEGASEQHYEVENVVSGDDATVSSEPNGDIPAKQHADMEIDVAGQDASLELEVPEVDFNKENGKGEGTSSSDGSHAVEARSETGQNDLMPHVDLVEMEIPAINNLGPHADSADGSHAVEDPSGTGSNDVVLHAEPPVVGIPVGHSMTSNVDSMDKSSPALNPNATGPNDIASHVNTGEIEILADNDSALHVGSSADGSNTVEDGNETAPTDMAPRVDPCEMNMPAVNDVAPNVDSVDGSHAIQDPPNETGLCGVSQHVDSDETEMPADIDMAPNVDSADGSHAIQVSPNETGLCGMSQHVDSDETEMPADIDMAPNVDSADGSHAIQVSPNKTGLCGMSQHVDSDETEMPADIDMAPNVDSADGSHAIQDPPNETGLCGMSPHVDSDETRMLADIDMAANDYSADISHAVEDPNKNGSNDASLHADSDQMGNPTANDLTPHIEYADGSHPNHVVPNVESAELAIPAGNCNQDKPQDTTPSVLQAASPVSDHSMPAIPEIHNDSHLLQQPSENGIQDQEGRADPTPMVETEDDIMQPVEAIQVDQIISEDSSLSPHDEPSSAISTDPTPMVETEDDIMQPVEAIQVDQIISEDSSLSPHDEPSSVISTDPTITENQAAMPSTSEVLVQTTAPPITAQDQIQLEQYMFDLQRRANSNRAGSRKTRRVDPLRIELEKLSFVKETMTKSYHKNIQKMNTDCEKEIAEAIAEIRLKYCNKRQEADATFNSQKKEVDNKMTTVVINQVLAATFRRKCQDVSRGCAAVRQACQAESMQQQRRFHGPSTCLPGQSSETQQALPPLPPPIPATAVATPPQQTQPPLQIVKKPSDLFLRRLIPRHPHTTNLRPANTTPIRAPPNTNFIPTIPSTTTTRLNPVAMSAATSRTNTETHGQSPQSRPLVSRVTRSTARHMQPLVDRERPSASSDVRSSTSHMRPSNPTSSSGSAGPGTYHRTLPVQHITSSPPLTSPSNSQQLNSTTSVQPQPPPPPPPSQLPHASATTSAPSSLPSGPSVPQSGGPQYKLNDNVNALTGNAARGLNILKTPEFPGGGNAAQPPSPSAHAVVYLSDDD